VINYSQFPVEHKKICEFRSTRKKSSVVSLQPTLSRQCAFCTCWRIWLRACDFASGEFYPPPSKISHN